MQTTFAERWHKETSYFHFPIGEMMIILDNIGCLLQFPIRGKLLDHSKLTKGEEVDMMTIYLGADPIEALM